MILFTFFSLKKNLFFCFPNPLPRSEKDKWLNEITRCIDNCKIQFKVFGAPLMYILRREGTAVPQFFRDALKAILNDPESEGIFRLSGIRRIINQTVHDLNQVFFSFFFF